LIYLDTSVIAPFYWQEQLSEVVQELLRNEPEVALSHLVEVELFSALSRRVRMGEISQAQAGAIADRFEYILIMGFILVFPLKHYTTG
jgi:predicted nucleic acid-binding protein